MDKVRCLIVDDEELVIQRLTLYFDGLRDDEYEFELVGKAYSGDEGLEAAGRLKPDIVITDIMMPGMDGITMIEQMKKPMPDIVFIILTAYSDFNYAKRAIRSNVSDYIVKVPLDEDELLRAMRKAAHTVQAARHKEDRLQKLNMSIMENRHRILKQFFHELIRGELMMKHAEGIAANLNMQIFQAHYCCAVIEMNHYMDFVNQYPLSDQSILKYGMLNVIEETIQQHGGGFAFGAEDHRFIGFIQWPHLHSQAANEQRYAEVGQALIGNLRTYLHQSVSVGFSTPRQGWPEITSSYLQARQCCDDSYYSEQESVHTPATCLAERNDDVSWLGPQLRNLLEHLQGNVDGKTIQDRLHSIADASRQRRVSRAEMTDQFREFLLEGRSRILRWKKELPEAGEDTLSYMSLNDQIAYIGSYLEKSLLVEEIPGRPEIAKAIAYIERNLTERLSLQMIAEQANLAPAYFSSLFKREMKESLIDYINRKKIEKAVELLKDRNYTLQELCEKVGIMNEAYFCTLFKQKTGKTPGQFRRKRSR